MKVACVQADVAFGDAKKNCERAVAEMMRLSREGVDLVVFPEAFLTGYCVERREDALRISIPGVARSLSEHPNPVDRFFHTGDIVQTLAHCADTADVVAVVGFAEYDEDGTLFNAAVLLEPRVAPRVYRKTHLPELGFDRFVRPGDELPVFETRLGRIGILICYDLRIPEAARTLALKGADLIVLPTNWPEGAEVSAEHITAARAAENRVFVATCNRVGEENGFRFIGRSKIVDPSGHVLAAAGAGEERLVADLDLEMARTKRTVVDPGRYEIDLFGARRPELYGALVESREQAGREAP